MAKCSVYTAMCLSHCGVLVARALQLHVHVRIHVHVHVVAHVHVQVHVMSSYVHCTCRYSVVHFVRDIPSMCEEC